VLSDAVTGWVHQVTGAAVRHVSELPGATSSLVVLVGLDNGAEFVLRLHTDDDWLAREPDLATREATALRALSGSGVVAPALVAVDEHGTVCGRPAVAMTRLPGRADLSDASPSRLRALADALRTLHRLPPPAALPAYRPYLTAATRIVPPWTRVPEAWRRAIEVCAAPPPSGRVCFIHRDYHAGNVLIDGGTISGIVDWVNACAGPVEVDVAHCRLNLALVHGLATAHTFASYAATEPRHQAYWDLVDSLDMFEGDARESRSAGADLVDGSDGLDGLDGLDGDARTVRSLRSMGAHELTVQLMHERFDEFVLDALRRWHAVR
jgi:aminoglycoside phosphotransferase (APT) family kinase protein